jgi:hypothetical protein
MSFLARKKRLDHDQDRFELRATASLQWMAAMVQHSTAISLTYAKVILAPVFRLVNSEKREVSNTLRWVNNDGVVVLACGVLGVFLTFIGLHLCGVVLLVVCCGWVSFVLPQSVGARIDGNVAGIHEGRARRGGHGVVYQDPRRNTRHSHGDQNGPKKKKSATKDCGPGRGGGVQDATEGCEKKKSR